MMFRNIALILLLIFLLPGKLPAQQGGFVNYTVNDGLPSNHIYSIIRDHLGYLWIATPKGVAKYNGYEFKVFTTRDGLPKNDIWQLTEDSLGKMWLISINSELGYIYNNTYHKCNLKNITGTLYPQSTVKYKKGIIFFSAYISKNAHPSLCIEENDTLRRYLLADSIRGKFYISDNGNIYIFWSNLFAKCVVRNDSVYVTDTVYRDRMNHSNFIFNLPNAFLGNMFAVYDPADTSMYIIDLVAKKEERIKLDENNVGKFVGFYRTENAINIVGNKAFLTISLTDNFDRYHGYTRTALDVSAIKNVNALNNDSTWGIWIGTRNNGLWRAVGRSMALRPIDGLDLEDYKNIGLKDNAGLWWSNNNNSMISVSNGKYKPVRSIKNTASLIKAGRSDTTLCYPSINGTYTFLYKVNYGPKARNPYFQVGVSGVFINDTEAYMSGSRGFYKHTYRKDSVLFEDIEHER
ncbi:MAG: hypothetical protein EBZ77_07940, partial [Chitinophagia bacterium]|nr:hypothetical protein [Chitinophagia bacterium]